MDLSFSGLSTPTFGAVPNPPHWDFLISPGFRIQLIHFKTSRNRDSTRTGLNKARVKWGSPQIRMENEHLNMCIYTIYKIIQVEEPKKDRKGSISIYPRISVRCYFSIFVRLKKNVTKSPRKSSRHRWHRHFIPFTKLVAVPLVAVPLVALPFH